MTFDEYVIEAQTYYRNANRAKKGAARLGQAYWNCLPKKYDYIAGTEYDPFYDDEILPEFLTFLAARWSD